MKKILCLILAALPAHAAEEASASAGSGSKPPQKIDVKGFPAEVINDVVVPAPSEVFAALDKIGPPLWANVLRRSKGTAAPMPEREHTALYLGTIIAEGFIAVEAKEAEEVKRIGRSVLNLSRAIGVPKAAEKRSMAIIDAADKKDWVTVQKEFDSALLDVKNAMAELGDIDISQLVSLGGWVRGTEALTEVVEKRYSKDGADLLHQPTLVEYFNRRITEMKPEQKNHLVVKEVQKGLGEIRPLMGGGDTISAKSIGEARKISSRVVKSIQSKSR